MKLRDLLEGKKPIPKFHNGWQIIDYLDDIPAFKKYRNKNANYDDVYFKIPTDVFIKVLGWTNSDIDKIRDGLEDYEGTIDYHKDGIYIFGGA